MNSQAVVSKLRGRGTVRGGSSAGVLVGPASGEAMEQVGPLAFPAAIGQAAFEGDPEAGHAPSIWDEPDRRRGDCSTGAREPSRKLSRRGLPLDVPWKAAGH